MANGMSRRGVAAAGIGAGLAAAGLAMDASAGKGKKKKQDIVSAGLLDTVNVEPTRITVPGVRYLTVVRHDGTSELVSDHARLVPQAGTSVDYHLSGTIVDAAPIRGEEAGIAGLVVFRATGGSYDPATGQLLLTGEVIAATIGGGAAGQRDDSVPCCGTLIHDILNVGMVAYVDPGLWW